VTPKLKAEIQKELNSLSPIQRVVFMKGVNLIHSQLWPLAELLEESLKRENKGMVSLSGKRVRQLLSVLGF
jgi:hypothetical protein